MAIAEQQLQEKGEPVQFAFVIPKCPPGSLVSVVAPDGVNLKIPLPMNVAPGMKLVMGKNDENVWGIICAQQEVYVPVAAPNDSINNSSSQPVSPERASSVSQPASTTWAERRGIGTPTESPLRTSAATWPEGTTTFEDSRSGGGGTLGGALSGSGGGSQPPSPESAPGSPLLSDRAGGGAQAMIGIVDQQPRSNLGTPTGSRQRFPIVGPGRTSARRTPTAVTPTSDRPRPNTAPLRPASAKPTSRSSKGEPPHLSSQPSSGRASAPGARVSQGSRSASPRSATTELNGHVPGVSGTATMSGRPASSRAADAAKYRDLIRGVYRRKNPSKLRELDSLLAKHRGDERGIYEHVCRKYGESPIN